MIDRGSFIVINNAASRPTTRLINTKMPTDHGVILVLLTLAKRDWPVVLVPWKDVSDECEEKTVYA